MQLQMLLFTQSRQFGFILSITKLKENKEDIYKFSWSLKFCYRHSCWYQLTSNYWDGWEAYFWERLQTLLQSLSFKCPSPIEINSRVTLLKIRSYAYLDYRKCVFLKTSIILSDTWLWAKIISRVTGEN